MTRLALATLPNLPAEVLRPGYDRAITGIGIVHLGVGAFHKAHQAVYTDHAMTLDAGNWAICGVSLRRPNARENLMPQDGFYIVGARQGDQEERRLIGAIKEVLTAPDNPQAVLDRLISPETHIVTLTITEKGYCLDPATGELDVTAPDIRDDLASLIAPKSALGYLVAALRIRRSKNRPSLTIMSCDNLPHNGQRLKSAVLQFAKLVDPELATWIEETTAFPATMVDRIVPATTPDDITANTQVIGLDDKGYTKTEPFHQWVIEDNFAGPRPAWEKAGALLVENVAIYEDAKLRLLNGPHSAIAYLGYLSGKEYVHDVMADPILSEFVTLLMEKEIVTTVAEPAEMPLGPYMADLRARFSNSALMHRTWQIAMDGSQKLPQRLLNTVRDRLAAGQDSPGIALAVAAWVQYVTGTTDADDTIDVQDPMAARFSELGTIHQRDTGALTDAFFAVREVFGDDLPQAERFRELVKEHLAEIRANGAAAATRIFLEQADG